MGVSSRCQERRSGRRSAGEDAQESDDIKGSFFTHHLVSALRGAADEDMDGRVVLEEAYRYTYNETLRASNRTPAAAFVCTLKAGRRFCQPCRWWYSSSRQPACWSGEKTTWRCRWT